jgi:hypothetical protein
MPATYGEGICCQYSAGEFKATVNGELVAISISGEFRDVVRRSFDVIGNSISLPSTTGWISRNMTTRMSRDGRCRVLRPVWFWPRPAFAK